MTAETDVFANLTPFLQKLKSDAPTPGGGAVAGLLGALAAALSHMVAALTVNKKKYAEHQAAFEEAMTAHMGTIAYLENRKVYWDKEKQEIV